MNTIKTLFRCAGVARLRDNASLRAAAARAQYPRNHGRRHRLLEHQCLQPRHDGLPHSQHRSYCQRWCHLHRLLRPAILRRGPRGVYYWAEPVANGVMKCVAGALQIIRIQGRRYRTVHSRRDQCSGRNIAFGLADRSRVSRTGRVRCVAAYPGRGIDYFGISNPNLRGFAQKRGFLGSKRERAVQCSGI